MKGYLSDWMSRMTLRATSRAFSASGTGAGERAFAFCTELTDLALPQALDQHESAGCSGYARRGSLISSRRRDEHRARGVLWLRT